MFHPSDVTFQPAGVSCLHPGMYCGDDLRMMRANGRISNVKKWR
jgi:hypothetical protein